MLTSRADDEWRKAATAWLVLGRPYPAAYAQWRQAEALLASRAPKAQAEETLWAAYAVAVRLGAAPLRRELSCWPSAAAYSWNRQPTQQSPCLRHLGGRLAWPDPTGG